MIYIRTFVAALVGVFLAASAQAAPFTLYYSVTSSGGGWDYDFEFVADDNDGTLGAGKRINWLIVGSKQSAPSDFSEGIGFFTSIPTGWYASASSGYQNGPTLCYSGNCSSPNAPVFTLGQSLLFSGHSASLIAEGDLKWSNLAGDTLASFETAVLRDTVPVPLPAGLPLLLAGLGALTATARRTRVKG